MILSPWTKRPTTSYSPGTFVFTVDKSYSTGNCKSTVSVASWLPTALNPVTPWGAGATGFFSVTTNVKNFEEAFSKFVVSSVSNWTLEISPLKVFILYLSLNA